MKYLFLFLFACGFMLSPLLAEENEACLSCHGQGSEGIPFVDSKKLESSIHGKNPCISCHADAEVVPHPSKPAPVSCAFCHEEVWKVYETSVHGKARAAGVKEAPTCIDCHGEHTIRSVSDPTSTVWKGKITKTCANCHDSEKIITKFGLPQDRLETFQNSYHGLASRGGDLRVANCASCHGWHGVLPSSDPASSIHPKNLHRTCGQCHPGAPTKLFHGRIHGNHQTEVFFLVRWARTFYLILIPAAALLMLLHNFSDFLRKARARFFPPATVLESKIDFSHIERLNVNERVQHMVLLLTFFLLAYTGFALKYPEMGWFAPLKWLGGETLRKTIHRWTALVFGMTAVYHLLYMVGTKRGRFLWRARLFPKVRDFNDFCRLFLHNLGLRSQAPKLPYPSYIEKIEYWALIWGSLIMILTGALLVFNDVTLRYLPLWVSELATLVHFYEAILACLSILIWHFYWTIFDPDIYPMNCSWLVGKARPKNG